MITGNSTWSTNLQQMQKYALYYLVIPGLGIFVLSFVASKASVPIS